MLLTKYVTVNWNSKNKKYYTERGYTFTKMKDPVQIKVEDLKPGSNIKVEVQCDYCGAINQVDWHSFLFMKNREYVHKDCCNNPDCTTKKAQETLEAKYHVKNAREIPGVNERIASTNLERYGCINPFGNETIQQKIRETNIEKYGVPVPTQNPKVAAKAKETCLMRYGVDNYCKQESYIKSVSGENSHNWKPIKNTYQFERMSTQYIKWRTNVFERDNFTCQHCGAHNHKGNNQSVVLNVHHIKSFSEFPHLRMDVNNGVTLCVDCHRQFHHLYGNKGFSEEDFNDFQNNKCNENIC